MRTVTLQPRLWRPDDAPPVKRYLMEYRTLLARRDALADELERLREATVRATARMDPGRTNTTHRHGASEDAMLRVLDGEERLRQIIAHAGEALSARLLLVERLPDERQKTLLTLRYINGWAWERIGYEMHYERTQVFEIHAQSLLEAQRVLDAMQSGSG